MQIKRIVILGLSLALVLALPAFAQISKDSLLKEGISEESFSNTITYFYVDHDKTKLISCLKVILDNPPFLNDKMHFMPLAHFFATVAHKDPDFRAELQRIKNDYNGIQEEAIEMIITESYNFYSPDAHQSPAALDYLWSEFSATGDESPVIKIIGVLDYERSTGKKLTDEDMNRALVFGAARWSLTSNAIQHKKVYDALNAEYKIATGRKKENIQEIIAAADKEMSQSK